MKALQRVASRQDGVVTRAQALAGLRQHQIDSLCGAGRWLRLACGAYLVDADTLDGVPRRARIRAAVLSLGPGASAVLGTAAELHGIGGLRSAEEIHVSVPPEAPRPQRVSGEVIVHQLSIPAQHRASVGGIPATTPLRTVSDLILKAPRYPAVCLLDSALSRGLITEEDFATIPALIRGRRGAVAARRYLADADGRAQSPLETRTRLRCVDGKVPPDVLQLDVRDEDGYLLGVGDMGWLAAKVIAEADGAGPHGTAEAIFQDRQRQNRIMNAGWIVLRFTWTDTLRPDYIPYVVREALRRRSLSS